MKQQVHFLSLTLLFLPLQWLLIPCTALALSVGRNKEKFIRRRRSGVKPKKTSKRTPRWEQEGDKLYQEIPVDRNLAVTYEEAIEKIHELENVVQLPSVPKRPAAKPQTVQKTAPPHMVWGTLPVGPILKKQLDAARISDPTPIQEASFGVVSKGNNAVIASATGTGKTLAYLVPLLATKSRKDCCQMCIVTPTVELAYQIQGEVDRLWPPVEGHSSAHVVGRQWTAQEDTLLASEILECPILCGTPRKIRDLLQQAKSGGTMGRRISEAWKSNLKTIVLDESDRLLRTEGNARRKEAGKKRPSPTQAQVLLSEMGNLQNHQLICASATVGRTLRRQLQEILDSPSIDRAAEVVTADTRATGKDVHKRRAGLLPETISHSCALLSETKEDGTLDALTSILNEMTPSTTIVFPGRWGVKQVQSHLKDAMGLQNILSIEDIHNGPQPGEQESWETAPVYVVPDKFARGLDISSVQQVFLLAPPTSAAGYMHLAGRTGRNGEKGRAITLVRPNEVPRLATIAERLGVAFGRMDLPQQEEQAAVEQEATGMQNPAAAVAADSWDHLSKSQLMRKTVAELKQYIEENTIPVRTPEEGKRILKADLVEAITGSP